MVSAFRRHQMRVRALQSGTTQSAPNAPPPELTPDTAVGQEYAVLRVLLHDNLRSLSEIASIEARNPVKAEYAKAFTPWIEGVLQAGEHGQAAQDEILVWNLIWAIDYRAWDYALCLAAHAIRFHLAAPERLNRNLSCFVAEEVATISLNQQEAVPHNVLCQVLSLIEGRDMADQAKAKLHKALARSFTRRADDFDPAADNAPAGGKAAYLTEALEHATRAFQLDSGSGVRSDIRSLEKALRKIRPADAPPSDADADENTQ